MIADHINGNETESMDAPDNRKFILVTAHFTVLDETEHGELKHQFIQDAKLNIFFNENGNAVSKNARRVVRVLKGLRKSDDRYIIVNKSLLRKKLYLCADVQGGFSRRKSVSEWEKFRLLPMDAALAAKSKDLPLDVVVTAVEKRAAPRVKYASGEQGAQITF